MTTTAPTAPTVPSVEPADALHTDPSPDPATAVPATLQRLRGQLPGRDIAVLRDLASLQLATGRQLQRLRFHDGSPLTRTRRANATLARLHRHELVARLGRRVGGPDGGSASHVYQLTPTGRRLLGIPGPRGGRRRQLTAPTRQRTAHTLAITEVAVQLVEAHRAGQLELIRFETEPHSWRRWTGPGGAHHQLRPDAFVIVAAGDWEHLAFVEVDLGTEHPGALRDKAAAYLGYAQSGLEQQTWAAFPHLLFLTHDRPRCDALTRTLNRVPEAAALLSVALLEDAPTALTTPPDHAPDDRTLVKEDNR